MCRQNKQGEFLVQGYAPFDGGVPLRFKSVFSHESPPTNTIYRRIQILSPVPSDNLDVVFPLTCTP